jgi:molybdopterin-guanine dinucleotide biosynthesis protein A
LEPAQTTLAVLAGGQGRRMGGPKSHLRIGGRPILQFLLDRFDWPGPTLVVTAPGVEHPPAAGCFDAEAIDSVAGQGPLRGVLTALETARTPLLVAVTVDMPGVSLEQLNWLLDQLDSEPRRLGVMSRRAQRVEPFPFACRDEARSILAQQLLIGRRSAHALLDLPGFVAEPVPSDWPAEIWANLNYPQDYQAFLANQG